MFAICSDDEYRRIDLSSTTEGFRFGMDRVDGIEKRSEEVPGCHGRDVATPEKTGRNYHAWNQLIAPSNANKDQALQDMR